MLETVCQLNIKVAIVVKYDGRRRKNKILYLNPALKVYPAGKGGVLQGDIDPMAHPTPEFNLGFTNNLLIFKV